ncbi:MAG: ribose 5-phosphate isomerase B, partial [Planctomycetota bacterium]|nr:ribose 5-phosphate isomerase B [Planctomycetota bacterium]
MIKEKIVIAADHAGFGMKEEIKHLLLTLGYEYDDLGTTDEQSVDYPDFAFRLAEDISSGNHKRGILICNTGLGMAISANKVKGIRAATCHNEFTAQMSRQHNDANVLCLGAKIIDKGTLPKVLKVWLETPF